MYTLPTPYYIFKQPVTEKYRFPPRLQGVSDKSR